MTRRKETLEARKLQVGMLNSARGLLQKPTIIADNLKLQNELGEDLLNWSKYDKLSIDDFFVEKRISPMRFYKACETNEYLSDCLEIALAAIGERLEEAIQSNQLYQIHNIKHYSSHYRQEARLKRESDKNSLIEAHKTIVYEPIGIPDYNKTK